MNLSEVIGFACGLVQVPIVLSVLPVFMVKNRHPSQYIISATTQALSFLHDFKHIPRPDAIHDIASTAKEQE